MQSSLPQPHTPLYLTARTSKSPDLANPPCVLHVNIDRTGQYTMVWNVLDYSTLVIPVSKVDSSIDLAKAPHVFYNEDDKTNYDICGFRFEHDDYFLDILNEPCRQPSTFCKCPHYCSSGGTDIGGRSCYCYGRNCRYCFERSQGCLNTGRCDIYNTRNPFPEWKQ